MNNQEYIGDEINIRRVIFSVMYNLKKLIVVGVIFAILLGGYKGIKTFNSPRMTDEQLAVAIDSYNAQKTAIENDIVKLNERIVYQQDYVDNSLLMNIDSNSFTRITGTYHFVPSDEMASVSNILNYLSTYLKASLNQIAGEHNLPISELKEIVSFTEDSENYSYIVTVMGNDEHETFEIFKELETFLYDFCNTILAKVTNFTVDRIGYVNSVASDSGVKEKQEAARNVLNDYRNQLLEQKNNLSELVYPSNDTKGKIDFKSTIKYVFVGFIVGVLVEAVWIALKDIYSDKVYNEYDISREGLTVLGTFVNKQKFDRLEKLLRGVEGKPLENDPCAIEYLKANVTFYKKGSNNVLIIGTSPEDRMVMYRDSINSIKGISSSTAGSILSDPLAVSKLADSDAVVFVVETGETSITDLKKQIKKVQEFGKRIVGAIIEE